jgi:vacuolar-type H+-ATPase subunit F/Vma7
MSESAVGTVVALGERRDLDGFALAGARVVTASGAGVIEVWRHLDDDVGLVILTESAARTLDDELDDRPDVLTVVVP